MIRKEFLLQQAKTLLKMAQVTRDRRVAANLTDKAAQLSERSDQVPTSEAPDQLRRTG